MLGDRETIKWLKENRTDEFGYISLNGIQALNLKFDFSNIKAELILNNCQEAKRIDNCYQESECIYNSNQKAKCIYNECQQAEKIYNSHQEAQYVDNKGQIILDKKAIRIKELKAELYKLENS